MFEIIVIVMLIGGVVGAIMGTLDGQEAKRKKEVAERQERSMAQYERRRAQAAQRENECLREENDRLRAERDDAEEKCSNLERKRQIDKEVKRIIRKSQTSQTSDEYRILKKYGYVTKRGPTSRNLNLEADLRNETSPIHKELREKGYFS